MGNKDNNGCCCALTIIGSLIGAAGIAALFFAGLIASITALSVITLIFGIISLLVVIFLVYCNRDEGCFCVGKSCLIATLVGSIITSSFALAATALAAASIPAAILVGAVTFFLIANLINLIKTIVCVICLRRCM